MNNASLQQVSEYSKKHRRKKRWQSVVTAMAAVVVFITTYALILPAITMDNEPSCNIEEHKHTDECFSDNDGEKVLYCTLTEHEHHEIACYADRSADVETKSDWEAVLNNVELIGAWQRDVVLVAKSQLDYHESIKNVICDENGELQGYTRYGEWYGNPYGKWSAMFVSFCLDYAGVQGMPLDDNCDGWIKTLSEAKYDLYRKADKHMPSFGEIVFFDKNGDGIADGAGIIAEVIPQIGDRGAKLKVIEGGSSERVQYVIYEYGSDAILGYSVLPDGMYKQQTLQAQIFTDGTYKNVFESTDTVIKVSGTLPKGGKIYAYPVDVHDSVCAYDITVFDSDGNVFEPLSGESLKVSIVSDELKNETFPDGVHPEVYYVPDDGTPERMPTDNTDDGVEFSAGHFSVYAVRAVSETKVSSLSALRSAISSSKPYIKLTASITVSSQSLNVNIGSKSMVIDLNGFRLTPGSNLKDTMFRLNSGNLTIVDTKQSSETVTQMDSSEPVYGSTATLSVKNNSATLTYYVTESTVINTQTGQTKETLSKHTVTASGAIVGNNYPVITVNGGEFTLEGGMIRSGTNRAVYQTGGTTNISGGYICGFTKKYTNIEWQDPNEFGGAILATNGTVNISESAVLAGNNAGLGGAIGVTGQQTVLNINGGVISGNTATYDDAEGSGGGGICANESTVTMTGGWVTHNTAKGTKYLDGGGGFYLKGHGCKFTISGGFVTANKANGGGGLKTKADESVTVNIDGGHFSGNLATACEGAGVAIERESTANIRKGYITNNILEQTEHWGGGGLFCAKPSTVNIENLLVTNNTAGGFGGGVAGCPTGKLYLYVDEGCAVFDNRDVVYGDVKWVSGGTKNEEDVRKCTTVFQNHGHADYFCALSGTVSGTMLGGGSAEWQGTADNFPVTGGKGDIIVSNDVMGLEANPGNEDKNAAYSVATVYINGNHSYTHGGGIMCNGDLIVGSATDITLPTHVQFQASNVLYKGGTTEELPLEGYNFRFQFIESYLNGTPIEDTISDKAGLVSFDNRIKLSEEGTYVYYIKGVPETENNTILYDDSIYKVTLKVELDDGVPINDGSLKDKKKYTYQITKMTVEKSTDEGDMWTNTYETTSPQSGSVVAKLSEGKAFVNRTMEFTTLTVKKEWQGEVGATSVTVTLKQDGVAYRTTTLNASNGWTHTWKDLPKGYTYTVEEATVPGYTASYNVVPGKTTENKTELGWGTYWVPATSIKSGGVYIIVSPDDKKALCVTKGKEDDVFTASDTANVNIQLSEMMLGGTKYTVWMSGQETIATGATFTPQNRSVGGIALKSDIGNAWLLAENKNGNFLKSTKDITYSSLVVCENGYLMVNEEFSGTADNLRTVVFENGKFNTVETRTPTTAAVILTQVSGNPTVTETTVEDVTVIITNSGSPVYQLPATGGSGSLMYIAAGASLLMLGVYLTYKKIMARKEETASF